MLEFLIFSTRPDGRLPLNNTATADDLWNTGLPEAVFDGRMRPDWRYIVSNGKEGERPAGAPSRFFPWAGQLISRSGWDADAYWSFFDVGPTGIADGHLDKLHLSISAYGMDLLEDSGVHGLSPPSGSSRAHNVVLIDGRDQAGEPLYAGQPVPDADFRITPDFDFARGRVDAFQGSGGNGPAHAGADGCARPLLGGGGSGRDGSASRCDGQLAISSGLLSRTGGCAAPAGRRGFGLGSCRRWSCR